MFCESKTTSIKRRRRPQGTTEGKRNSLTNQEHKRASCSFGRNNTGYQFKTKAKQRKHIVTMSSSNKQPPSKSPRTRVSNSALEVSEKDIANMGVFSPSGENQGWNKVSPKFQRLSVRAGDAPKIAPANLDDDEVNRTAKSKPSSSSSSSTTPDDVDAIRKKNQQRLAEVAQKKAERETAAALRKSKRESLSASAQLNYNHSDYDDDDDNEEYVASPKTTSRGIVPSHNRRASTGTVDMKSKTDADDAAALQRMSLYSPQRKVKTFQNADKGIYSPATDAKGWSKVKPKLTLPESPDL